MLQKAGGEQLVPPTLARENCLAVLGFAGTLVGGYAF